MDTKNYGETARLIFQTVPPPPPLFLSLWGNIKYLETDGVRYALDRMEIKVWMMDGESGELIL